MYKVGDVVIVRPDLKEFRLSDFDVGLVKCMKKYAAKKAVITRAWVNGKGNNRYLIDIDTSYSYWEDALFVPYGLDKLKDFMVSLCSK